MAIIYLITQHVINNGQSIKCSSNVNLTANISSNFICYQRTNNVISDKNEMCVKLSKYKISFLFRCRKDTH